MNPVIFRWQAPNWVASYGVAIVATAIAVWARLLMDPFLDDECPFSLFYLSVLLTAWIAGAGPAYLAVGLGTVAAAFFFIKPQSSLAIDTVSEVIQLSTYVIVNCIAAVLFDRLRRQRTLAEQRSRDNEQLSNSLREADERKDEFLALLAHELRNPLSPIRSGLEMLAREQHLSPTIDRVRHVIARQTNHLVRLTNDLLDVSRFSRGKMELRIACFDLRDALDDAIEMTAADIRDREHVFQRLAPDGPVWVLGDRVRLAQLAANLLGNAAKYTPHGGRIVLELDPTPEAVVVAVSDNGIGFPPEQSDSILLPFRQIDMSRTRDHGGLGLGLAIVKRIAELHDGELIATSPGPGRGSCFTLRLPPASPPPQGTAYSEDDQAVAAPGRSMDDTADDSLTQAKHILVVEDGADAGDLLRDLLELEGYTVDLARDGVSAIQLAGARLPDVCVMDIGLPGMDGYEVARRIRKLDTSGEVRLIAVTGWGSEDARDKSRQAGIDVHMVKPIIYSELMDHISGAVGMEDDGAEQAEASVFV